MSQWTCDACTLFNVLHVDICAACGTSRKREGEEGKKCSACTYVNAPSASSCQLCDYEFTATERRSNIIKPVSTVLPAKSDPSFKRQAFANSFQFVKASEVAASPHFTGSFKGSHSILNKINPIEDHLQDTEDDSAESESHDKQGEEEDLEVISISDSGESLGEQSDGLAPDEDIEECEGAAGLPVPPSVQATHVAGVVEVAPTLPQLTPHYWSVRHIASLGVSSINFHDFTLDRGASNPNAPLKKASSKAPSGTDYERRKRARDAKESKKKKKTKSSSSYAKNREKIAKKIAAARSKAKARRK